MQNPVDDQFEAYLKKFHPVAPEPVAPINAQSRSCRLPSHRVLLPLAALVLAGAAILLIQDRRTLLSDPSDIALGQRRAPPELLTLRGANEWLAASPSLKAAIDDLAFRPQNETIPQGKQSALAILSKERNRL